MGRDVRPICAICNKRAVRTLGRNKRGEQKIDYKCGSCHKKGLKGSPNPGVVVITERPTCRVCNKNKGRYKLTKPNGRVRYHNICRSCYCKQRKAAGRPVPTSTTRERHIKDSCEACSFVPVDLVQLQLDHKDGNRRNNHPSNLQTLCANCHALKTKQAGDYKPRQRPNAPYVWVGGRWMDRAS